MKRTQFKNSKFSGKGFYIALAVSLLAVAIATTIAVSRTISNTNKQKAVLESQTSSDTTAANEEVNEVQKETSQPEQSSKSEESSGQSSKSNAVAKSETPTKFAMPLDGEIINDYSNGELVKSETMGDWRTHDGIDIAAKQSTPVKAIANGTVTEIKNDGLWGTCITIDHGNGLQSIYCGLNEQVNVKADQKVKLGDVIGSVGKTNELENALEDHLHLGMKKDGKWVNPHDYIKN